MSHGYRCHCQRCTIRGLMGPAILITIGVLFLIERSSWDYGFSRTWPVILLVIGAVKLGESLASTEGHIGPQGPQLPQGVVPPPPPPPMPPQPPRLS
jgi:hypothetical protein